MARRIEALECPDTSNQPGRSTSWCDAASSRFEDDLLCLAEPLDLPGIGNIDEEFIGGDVCILGKFRSPTNLENLVDFVVAYDFEAGAMTNPLTGPSGVFSPQPGVPEQQPGATNFTTFINTGEFRTSFALDTDGIYDLTIQARVLTNDGQFQNFETTRRILRVASPHLTVTGAESTGTSTTGSPQFAASAPTDSDGDGLPDWHEDGNGNGTVDEGETNPNDSDHPDPDTDAAAHYTDLSAGPDTTVAVRYIKLCVAPHNAEEHENDFGGYDVAILATNNVTDTTVNPPRTVTLKTSCNLDASLEALAGDRLCPVAPTGDFCGGGYIMTVPMANGTNRIELNVEKLVNGANFGAHQRINVGPIENDLKGPALAISYHNGSGPALENVDGKVLLPSEASAVTVKVTPSEDLTEAPTIQFNNNPETVTMTRAGNSYQALMESCRFPINTVTINAKDPAGNLTQVIHSFACGNVRSLFDSQGNFSLQQAMVPNGVGAFLTADYIQNEVKPLLLQVLKSDKFKNENFFKLLDPVVPKDNEIECLRNLEEELDHKCQFIDHYEAGDKSWAVAIKGFCGDVGSDQKNAVCDRIGDFEIPSLQILNNNRLRIQLKLNGLRERGEMYTCDFLDSDEDGLKDLEDPDDDNDGYCDENKEVRGICHQYFNDVDADHDGICDHHAGVRDECHLDQIVDRSDCPDVEPDDDPADYKGCSDQDDDNDRIPDDHDSSCRIIPDPDFGTYIIPIKFAVKTLVLNLEVELSRADPNDPNSLLKATIRPLPASYADEIGARDIVEFESDSGGIIHFDCGKPESETISGGYKHYGDGGPDPFNGSTLYIDPEACEGLKNLDNLLRGGGNFIERGFMWAGKQIEGSIDPTKRANQNVDQQLWCTMQATTRCSIPSRLNNALDDFEIDIANPEQTKKVAAFSTKLMKKRFHFDFFSPVGSSNLTIDPVGLGFSGRGVLLPAGVTDEDDDAERDASDFLRALPERIRQASGNQNFPFAKFGPVSAPEAPAEDQVGPIEAAYNLGSEIGLALKEETINSLLQAISVTLFDLNRIEEDDPALRDDKRTLDLDSRRLRIDNGFGVPDIGNPDCLDKNGVNVNPIEGDIDNMDDWKCFPFSLDIHSIFGDDVLDYVDLNNDHFLKPAAEDAKVPILFRTQLNPFLAPTVRLVSVTAQDTGDLGHSSRMPEIEAELEIGISDLTMMVFEEETEVVDGVIRCKVDPVTDRCKIKDWCADDRFPGMDPARCDPHPAIAEDGKSNKRKSPMMVFSASGRLFLKLFLDLSQPGLISIRAGLSSVDSASAGPVLDQDKTYLNLSVLENNTILPDNALIPGFQRNLIQILSDYAYNGSRTINVQIPGMFPILRAPGPLVAFCERYPRVHEICKCLTDPNADGCDSINDLQKSWDDADLEQFGISGLEIQDPILGIAGSGTYSDNPDEAFRAMGGSPRYLQVGIGTCLKDAEGRCIDESAASNGSGDGGNNSQESTIMRALRSYMRW